MMYIASTILCQVSENIVGQEYIPRAVGRLEGGSATSKLSVQGQPA